MMKIPITIVNASTGPAMYIRKYPRNRKAMIIKNTAKAFINALRIRAIIIQLLLFVLRIHQPLHDKLCPQLHRLATLLYQ